MRSARYADSMTWPRKSIEIGRSCSTVNPSEHKPFNDFRQQYDDFSVSSVDLRVLRVIVLNPVN